MPSQQTQMMIILQHLKVHIKFLCFHNKLIEPLHLIWRSYRKQKNHLVVHYWLELIRHHYQKMVDDHYQSRNSRIHSSKNEEEYQSQDLIMVLVHTTLNYVQSQIQKKICLHKELQERIQKLESLLIYYYKEITLMNSMMIIDYMIIWIRR